MAYIPYPEGIGVLRHSYKFVDAYVAGNANLLVTNDRHFDVLRQVDYPPVEVVSIDMFKSTINCSRFAVM
jgi:predicted nucleic acid-binding protein